MTAAELVLVAHGTRSRVGVETVAALSDAVAERVGAVRTAFVDVLGPSPAEVLRDVNPVEPVVLVPAFLASGYHVHTDVPRGVIESGHPRVTVTRALGPHPVLARVLEQRVRESGWRPGDAVVLAAAGSSDPRARHDVRRAAAMLSARVRRDVPVAYIATGTPTVAEAVRRLRAVGERRVFVASYLLAPGLFHARLQQARADGVAAPLGAHPAVVELVAEKFFLANPQSRFSGRNPTGVRRSTAR
ncbi:sirohydrochlorin chelatase [Prescottella agglutinans]|uniref:Sirohydrochlorin ferrochelatase n=1 Tax=Prescottella agglutinans TaxID=1644129 RepID=A0ABT6MCG5_9NOCA|nr:sirohydrochlorin chelatase [Prescottella agglutinans]MDH6281993.1 sirohydrochlorin ferrochelatase [Prescottella agglutinans]